MNVFPQISSSKPRKKIHFSNPLSGLVYNNNSFLRSCHYLEQQDLQKAKRNTHSQLSTTHKSKNSQSMHHQAKNKYLVKKNNVRNSVDPEMYHYMNATQQFMNETNHEKNGSDSYRMPSSKSNYFDQKEKKKTIGQFPDITIKILDLINTHQDLAASKQIKVNFTQYFNTFFQGALVGSPSTQFLQIVEKYIGILVAKNQLDKSIDVRDYPAQIFKIKSKRTFTDRAIEYEYKKQFQNIEVMVRQYCVPNPQFRESCLKDILFMLSRSLYQKFNMNKENQYVLLNSHGQLINDICEIKFSTKILLIAQKQSYNKMYEKYVFIIDDNQHVLNRLSFSDNLKKTFRQKIVKGRVMEEEENDEDQKKHGKNLEKIENKLLIKSRNNSKKNISNNLAKTHTYFYSKRTSNLQKNRPYTNLSIKSPTNSRSKSPQNMYHRKNQSSLEAEFSKQKIALRSKSPAPTNPIRMQQSLDELIQRKKRYEHYHQKFQYLINQNSHYSITFNHENDNKVLMKSLRKFSHLFNTKNDEQIDRILDSLEILYEPLLSGQNMPQQSKLMPKKQVTRKRRQFILWEEFKNMQEIAACKGDKQPIIAFVNNYIQWNQFGQINREDLGKIIQVAIGGKNIPRQKNSSVSISDEDSKSKLFQQIYEQKDILMNLTDSNKQVIEQIIWSWLQKNKLIENDVLSKNTLQSWYKKNKLAYVLLVSLIFGTNIVSVLDMAYEVII